MSPQFLSALYLERPNAHLVLTLPMSGVEFK